MDNVNLERVAICPHCGGTSGWTQLRQVRIRVSGRFGSKEPTMRDSAEVEFYKGTIYCIDCNKRLVSCATPEKLPEFSFKPDALKQGNRVVIKSNLDPNFIAEDIVEFVTFTGYRTKNNGSFRFSGKRHSSMDGKYIEGLKDG